MISFLGNITLIAALLFSVIQSTLPIFGYYFKNPYLLASARPSVFAQFVTIVIAYILLMIGFATNDFYIPYIAANSHPSLPLMYRLTAVWGGHEGSILLWVLVLNIWATVFAFKRTADTMTISILGMISFCFLCFLFFTSNPFVSTDLLQQPRDLNPLLQDPGFVIHPPMLYTGYVGFSVAFAITLAALIKGKLDQTWASLTRCYATTAWCFLTFGILLGSWWAYRVLGWGGFWFWDPVENASLLPWLAGTALIHVLALVEKRDIAKNWAALLGMICFALSLMGTFLVRSGVLISAHTFANDPARGVFLLIILGILIFAATIIYLLRTSLTQSAQFTFPLLSRESLLLANSILFMIAMLTILLGTIYPLIFDALHLGAISVGAPYFNFVMLPLVCITLTLMTLVPMRQLKTGMSIAHSGFLILVLGVLLSSFLSTEKEVRVKPGDTTMMGPYQFLFIDTIGIREANYRGIRAGFEVTKNAHHVVNLYPEKRIYTVRDMVMTNVDIHPGIFRDLYIALGEPLNSNEWSVRIYYKPFIRWIWFGGLMMMVGGLVSILRRAK